MTRTPIAELPAAVLIYRAAKYRGMAADASTAETRDALHRIAERYVALALARPHPTTEHIDMAQGMMRVSGAAQSSRDPGR